MPKQSLTKKRNSKKKSAKKTTNNGNVSVGKVKRGSIDEFRIKANIGQRIDRKKIRDI